MRVGNYSLRIPEGREQDSGHVALPHNTQYRLELRNHHHLRCDALVLVDGKDVGTFRLAPHETMLLERGANDVGKFTSLDVNTADAVAAGVGGVAESERGLVQVTFKPERPSPLRVRTMSAAPIPKGQSWNSDYQQQYQNSTLEGTTQCCSADERREVKTCGGMLRGFSAAITGLTGASDQRFHTVGPLDYALGEEVTISVRLVAGPAVRPVVAVSRGNAVPPPV